MSAFSAANVANAIDRVPVTATKDLRALLKRAKDRSIVGLMKAIEAELALRGPMDFDAATAAQHALWAEETRDMALTDAIATAFAARPINKAERALTEEIARNPGVSYDALTLVRGKGDVGLILGHMVYERLGFFRRFLTGVDRMSDLLFARELMSGRMSYKLTPEAQAALQSLGTFEKAE